MLLQLCARNTFMPSPAFAPHLLPRTDSQTFFFTTQTHTVAQSLLGSGIFFELVQRVYVNLCIPALPEPGTIPQLVCCFFVFFGDLLYPLRVLSGEYQQITTGGTAQSSLEPRWFGGGQPTIPGCVCWCNITHPPSCCFQPSPPPPRVGHPPIGRCPRTGPIRDCRCHGAHALSSHLPARVDRLRSPTLVLVTVGTSLALLSARR